MSKTTSVPGDPFSDYKGTKSSYEQTCLKLLYIAVYFGLGILNTTYLSPLNGKYAREIRPRTISEAPQGGSKHSSRPKLPISLHEIIGAFEKGLGDAELEKAKQKWRWVMRNNGDKFLIRYLIAYPELKKAAKYLGEGLNQQLTRFNAEEELMRGEIYYLSQDVGYLKHLQRKCALLIGHDYNNAPLLLFQPALHRIKDQTIDVTDRESAVLLEHTMMLLPDHLTGSTMILDMGKFKPSKWDQNWPPVFLNLVYKSYPLTISRVIFHRPNRFFTLIWKILKQFFESSRTNIVVFTHTTEDLLQYVPEDQLPPFLGGTASRDILNWCDPSELDEVRDEATKHRLINERFELQLEFEQATIDWFTGNAGSKTRRGILLDMEDNYWKLDPYVRRRTLWDRNGTLAKFRDQLAPGGISQPICKVREPNPEIEPQFTNNTESTAAEDDIAEVLASSYLTAKT